jgi:hypothetical protein
MKQNRDQKNNKGSNESSETKIYLTPDSTLQTPEEYQHDKNINPSRNNTIDVSNDDLHETNADRIAGSDRAGIAERKNNERHNDEE